jgi:hypothetical protein
MASLQIGNFVPELFRPFKNVHIDEHQAEGAAKAIKNHNESLAALQFYLQANQKDSLNQLISEVTAKGNALAAHGTFDKNGVFKPGDGIKEDAYKAARTAFNEAKDKLTKGLKTAAEAENAPAAVKNFVSAQAEAASMANNLFGQVKAKGLGGAIANNFNYKSVSNGGGWWGAGTVFARSAFTLVGIGAVYDSFSRSQTGPEEDRKDRSMFIRAAEFTAGIAAIVASLFMSKLARAT